MVLVPLIIIFFIFHVVELLHQFIVLFLLLDLFLAFLLLIEFRLGLLIQFLELFIIYYVVLGLHEINKLYALSWVLLKHGLQHLLAHLGYRLRFL